MKTKIISFIFCATTIIMHAQNKQTTIDLSKPEVIFKYLSGKIFYCTTSHARITFSKDGHNASNSGVTANNGATYQNVIGIVLIPTISYVHYDQTTILRNITIQYNNDSINADGFTIYRTGDFVGSPFGNGTDCSSKNNKGYIILKTDTLTLLSGQVSMGAGSYMSFKKNNKDTLYSFLFNTYTVDGQGSTEENVFGPSSDARAVNPKILNKKFAVTYYADSIPMPNNETILGANIIQLVLIEKSKAAKAMGFMKKLSH